MDGEALRHRALKFKATLQVLEPAPEGALVMQQLRYA
jgi:hypothetical protein